MGTIYLTPKCTECAEITEKRSRFIANIKSVSTEQEALDFIKEIKKKYYDAKHNVFAYITEDIKRYNDDGEPSKTGGYPILEMLDAQNITDVVCVVTRYFGGILLGTGGLVRAYTTAAKEALEKAGLKEMKLYDELTVNIAYNLFENLKYIAGKFNCEITNCEYSDSVTVYIACESDNADNFKKVVKDTLGREIAITEGNKVYR